MSRTTAPSTNSDASRSPSANAWSAPKRRVAGRPRSRVTAIAASPATPGDVIRPPSYPCSRLGGHEELFAAAREQAQRLLVHLDDRVRQPGVVERVGVRLAVVDRPVEEAGQRQAARLVLRVLVDD